MRNGQFCQPSDKAFWKVLKNLGISKSLIPTLSDGQESVADNFGKAQLLSKKFSAAFNTIDHPLSSLDQIPTTSVCPDDQLITEAEVFKYLASIDCSKATGPDHISGTMLKNTATAITPVITALFNLSIKNCTFPNCWKTSNIYPILKVVI